MLRREAESLRGGAGGAKQTCIEKYNRRMKFVRIALFSMFVFVACMFVVHGSLIYWDTVRDGHENNDYCQLDTYYVDHDSLGLLTDSVYHAIRAVLTITISIWLIYSTAKTYKLLK